jgi:anti-sigma B factor antagonist
MCSIKRKHPQRPFAMLQLDGAIDSSSTAKLDEVLTLLLGQGHTRIVVDVTNVEYVSSAGWRSFLGAVRAASEKQTSLLFVGMRPTVKDVFDLLGLERVIEAHDTIGSVLRATQASAPTTTEG